MAACHVDPRFATEIWTVLLQRAVKDTQVGQIRSAFRLLKSVQEFPSELSHRLSMQESCIADEVSRWQEALQRLAHGRKQLGSGRRRSPRHSAHSLEGAKRVRAIPVSSPPPRDQSHREGVDDPTGEVEGGQGERSGRSWWLFAVLCGGMESHPPLATGG